MNIQEEVILTKNFEELYQTVVDPWHQSTIERYTCDKAIGINAIERLVSENKVKNVIEFGCGLGHFTKRIKNTGVNVLGVDISQTAIKKAKLNYPDCNFQVGNISDERFYSPYTVDLIILSEITWYILEDLEKLLSFYKKNLKGVYLLHHLVFYKKGHQKYGIDKFTDLKECLKYFGLNYLEYGEISGSKYEDNFRTFFLGVI
jgi:SAM-dependent methyltransferase